MLKKQKLVMVGPKVLNGGRSILISDSEDNEECQTVPKNTATSATPAASPTKQTTTTPEPPKKPKEKHPNLPPILFYESRSPNNGKDITPVYEESSSSILSMNASMNFQSLSSMQIPTSTPLEPPSTSPFEYSLISDTSLQVTMVGAEDKTLTQGYDDFLRLDKSEDETLRVTEDDKKAEKEEGKAKEETTRKRSAEEAGCASENDTKAKKSAVDSPLEDGEIIDLDDVKDSSSEDDDGNGANGGVDDSVVFVSEEVLSSRKRSELAAKLNMVNVLRQRAEQSPKPRLPNTLVPPPQPNKKKRMVIIDGSNVAFSFRENGRFCVLGLELCLKHFHAMGFDAKAVVPQFRMKRTQTDNHAKMLDLEQRRLLIKTPAKDLEGKFAASYDDRFILNIAKEFDAAVVSNDHYRDLMAESQDFAYVIKNRVIGYTWVMDKLFIPDDPYGKIGPSLNDILYADEKPQDQQWVEIK